MSVDNIVNRLYNLAIEHVPFLSSFKDNCETNSKNISSAIEDISIDTESTSNDIENIEENEEADN